MFKVIYDFKAKDGFLLTSEQLFKNMQDAIHFMHVIMSKDDYLIGKPILERM